MSKSRPTRKKRKLKKGVKITGIVFLVGIFALLSYFPVKGKINKMLHPEPVGTVKVDQFRDLNNLHLKHAQNNGIPAFKTEQAFSDGIEELLKDDRLVEISDNRYYRICELTHSHPYLTPQAKEFLSDLGKRFQNKLDEAGLDGYYFQISSLLRTAEQQRQLSRSNVNASPNSSHYYGNTFDIPYSTVIKNTFLWIEAEVIDGPASKLLSESLKELREEGRCVVVTERQERCFHITVVAE